MDACAARFKQQMRPGRATILRPLPRTWCSGISIEPAAASAVRPGMALLLDVLEHCNNPWLAARNISDFLLPGGFIVITTPNPRFSRSRMYALAKGFPLCFTQSDLDFNHHVFTPWPHIIERLLQDTGFSITQYVTLDGPTIWPRAPYNLRYPLRVAFAAGQ